ncbi:HNH endonuclease signature motif containing protein [Gryllotalpicola ginsengisoli]|uniref:HNH endonuclease signature motif containing protein n=1 Tax=Gryllotalpicola ginsengisoli TaxID=444608 RepID=UPI0003B612D7|nr:HNH endonuclease signature motif containing protein [Gryllotalpicola ginsengisoli]
MKTGTPTQSAWERVREQGLDEARAALREQAIAEARVIAAICDVVDNAVAHPQIELEPGVETHPEADGLAQRSAILGLALELGFSQGQVAAKLSSGRRLRRDLPRTWAAFRSGELTSQKARIILDKAAELPDDQMVLDWFDDDISRIAAGLTAAQLRRKAAVLARRYGAESLDARHARAARKRGVWIEPDDEGMAWLTAYSERSVDEKRADVFADILLGRGTPFEVRPTVNVYVPVLNLIDCPDSRRQATIEGVVPIPRGRAKTLVGGSATLTRIFTDPVDGAILGVGRKNYPPGADLKRFVLARDETCTAPGCIRPASSCDIDHRLDWAKGGMTDASNLHALCASDHTLKHKTKWAVSVGPRGHDYWRSPGGRVYRDTSDDPPPLRPRAP